MGKTLQGPSLEQVEPLIVIARHDDCEIHDLLGELLKRVEGKTTDQEHSHNGNGHGIGSEVVFEVSLDTGHYTLIRSLPPPHGPAVCLSPREQEIARLVSNGLPNKAIASILDISPWTVGTHLRRVFGKLGVSSRAEMVARVLKEDLLSESQDPSQPARDKGQTPSSTRIQSPSR